MKKLSLTKKQAKEAIKFMNDLLILPENNVAGYYNVQDFCEVLGLQVEGMPDIKLYTSEYEDSVVENDTPRSHVDDLFKKMNEG